MRINLVRSCWGFSSLRVPRAAFHPSRLQSQRLLLACTLLCPTPAPSAPRLSSTGAEAPRDRGCKAGSPRWPSRLQGAAPLRPHFSTSPPPQPVARLRCSVPAPSWSLPHLPTPTGRSTGGKRAPGPPDQMAPAVLPKVRGTRGKPGPRRWAVGPGVSAPEATLFFSVVD